MSGGFSHIEPRYLPELQARLFKKIDSFSEFKNKKAFDDFIAEIDLIMYSLHLPFDGSGRAIEDFIVFLGEKYGYPLSFTVLGYREAGSPLLSEKEEVGPKVKRELNALILKRFGIESEAIRDTDVIQLLKKKFSCNTQEAWTVWDAEKALVTAELIAKLGSQSIEEQYLNLIPSFNALRELWTEASTLRFVTVPEHYKSQVDELVANINSESTSESRRKVFEDLDQLKLSKEAVVRKIALMLEAYAIGLFGGFEGRNQADILYNLFSDTPRVIKKAAKEGSELTKLKAKLKLVRLGLSG